MTVTITIPGLRVISEANKREHWSARYRRAQAQKKVVLVELSNSIKKKEFKKTFSPPIEIELIRMDSHKMDSDNLARAFKHVRDGIADFFDTDDGNENFFSWKYSQIIEKGNGYGVIIKITANFYQ